MNIWGKILYRGNSPYNGEIKVVEYRDQVRIFASNFAQSRSLDKNGKSEFYWDAFVEASSDIRPGSKVLILGLGSGTTALALRRKFPKIHIDGVEIDPLMVELGKKYLGLGNSGINVIVEDAQTFVDKAKEKYDLIFVDLFVGGEVPVFVMVESFFKKLVSLLNAQGVLITNKIYNSRQEAKETKSFFEKFMKVVAEKHSSGWANPGNIILVGKKYE